MDGGIFFFFWKPTIFVIKCYHSEERVDKDKATHTYGARELFEADLTYSDVEALFYDNHILKTTELTDEYTFEEYTTRLENKPIPLFAIDPQRNIYVFTNEVDFKPVSGWRIISISPDKKPDEIKETKKNNGQPQPDSSKR